MKNCIVYIGDFDFRNENVQAHLVKNNGKALNSLGYHVEYIGVNRKEQSFSAVSALSECHCAETGDYFELPESLCFNGLFRVPQICRMILNRLDQIRETYSVVGVITYQSPTYAIALKKIAKWCKKLKISYIVNCADLPIFILQSPIKKIVMKTNWHALHRINKKYADGVIAVSKYIANFYQKPGRASIVIPPLFDTANEMPTFEKNEVATFVYAGTPFVINGRAASPEGMKDRLDKVVDLFLALSKQGVSYCFNIVGITKEDYLVGVPRHREVLSKNAQIHFLGKKSHAETLQMVSKADFSINYRDENLMTKAGFSTKIVESVSLGTPVIINDISDTFDYLQDGRDGFMLSGEMENDIELLSCLCKAPSNERAALKSKLQEKCVFGIEKYEQQLDRFLESMNL